MSSLAPSLLSVLLSLDDSYTDEPAYVAPAAAGGGTEVTVADYNPSTDV